MYYNNNKVSLLIGLLKAYGIRDVVLCPGSRNAMIVNNIVVDGGFRCYPVTDERSAGFFALGISMEKGPVAIVVTSGSALLDVAPAVVEAYYQHRPMVVISADRPQEDIDQNVGQTMRQAGALDNFVRRSVNLVDTLADNNSFHRRLVCEALCACTSGAGGPVHVNVPLPNVTECETLEHMVIEEGRKVEIMRPSDVPEEYLELVEQKLLHRSERPVIVVGQTTLALSAEKMERIRKHVTVLSEPLSDPSARPFDGIVGTMPDDKLPDFILYLGESLVCRSINSRFASAEGVEVWRVSEDDSYVSPFRQLDRIIVCSPDKFLSALCDRLCRNDANVSDYLSWWNNAFAEEEERILASTDSACLSAASTVEYFESQLEDMFYDYSVHYANSTAVRLACRYVNGHTIRCNRGVNGIDGCISTAAGHSASTGDMVFCVTGDLSFFYDQNALWNNNLKGNLRIILLNDHRGGIFDKVSGLEGCSCRDTYVAGSHKADARGICTQNDIGYLSATTVDEMHLGIVKLMTEETKRPILLEIEY